MNFDLELDKAVKEIESSKAKRVCIQLPDGLKTRALEVYDHLKANTKAEILIWMGSCFGACDVPNGLENLKVDLLIQRGHSRFSTPKFG